MAKEFVIFPIIPFLENKILDLLLPKITPKIYEKFATVTQEALFQTNIKNFSAKRLFKAITPHEVLLERIEFKIIQSAISLINLPTGLFYYPLLSSLNIWRVGEVYGQQKDKINPSEIISTTLLSLPPPCLRKEVYNNPLLPRRLLHQDKQIYRFGCSRILFHENTGLSVQRYTSIQRTTSESP